MANNENSWTLDQLIRHLEEADATSTGSTVTAGIPVRYADGQIIQAFVVKRKQSIPPSDTGGMSNIHAQAMNRDIEAAMRRHPAGNQRPTYDLPPITDEVGQFASIRKRRPTN